MSLGELGILFVLPLWVQNVLGYTALQTGLVLVALAVGSFLATGMVGGLRGRISAIGMLRLGIALELVGVLLIGFLLDPALSWVALAGVLFTYGLGLGLASSQVTNVVLRDVPVERSGQAAGTQSTARQVGSALGIAILGTVLFGVLAADLGQRLADDGYIDAQSAGIVSAVTDSAGAVIPALEADPGTAAVGQVAAESSTLATSAAAYTGAAFLGVALLASVGLRATNRSTDETTTTESIPASVEPSAATRRRIAYRPGASSRGGCASSAGTGTSESATPGESSRSHAVTSPSPMFTRNHDGPPARPARISFWTSS